jgi:hypothetical protein
MQSLNKENKQLLLENKERRSIIDSRHTIIINFVETKDKEVLLNENAKLKDAEKTKETDSNSDELNIKGT